MPVIQFMLLLLMQWSHHCCNSNNNNDNNDYCNNYNGIDNNLKVMIHCYYNFLNLVLLFLVLFLFATPQEKKINPVGIMLFMV